jgi:hypothetical protein
MSIVLGGGVAVLVLMRRRAGGGLGAHLALACAALGQTLLLGAYMLVETGALTYYFWKLGLGSLLVTTVVVVHAWVTTRPSGARPRPVAVLALTILAALGYGSTLHEFTAPSAVWAAIVPVSLADRQDNGDAGDVGVVLDLAAAHAPSDAARTRLLATRPEDMNPAHASEWFHALSHSATHRAMNVDDGIYDLALDPDDTQLAVSLALETLATEDGRVIVTDPRLRQAILDAAGPGAEQRVSVAP